MTGGFVQGNPCVVRLVIALGQNHDECRGLYQDILRRTAQKKAWGGWRAESDHSTQM
jgi:hypothetical protein